MELSRQEYPALLGVLQPNQAVAILNDRVKLIGRINSDIADWLLERRRVEEAYVQGLRKLASKRQQDAGAEFGIFQQPWQSIVTSAESLAQSHNILAQKIEADVERPLREYQTKNREMQAMSTIQGNLAAMARELEDAQRKADKLRAKGGKAVANKVSIATTDVDNASQQWDSQAPFVFEQLQALDESRVNHLRDILTQFETHEVDQVERNRVTAEGCLNLLLNVDTTDEISTFVARISGGRPSIPPRQQSRAGPTSALAPPISSHFVDDGRSERSATSGGAPRKGSAQEQRPGGMGGLKRLGTVIGRRKQSAKSSDRPPSPEKRSRPSRNPLRRGPSSRDMQQIPSPNASTTNLPSSPPRQETPVRKNSLPAKTDETQRREFTQSPLEQREDESHLNGDTIGSAPEDTILPNGTLPSQITPQMQQQPAESQRDLEGFNVPPSGIDDITRAQQEAATENEVPQFKLDIRNEPIQEEDGDAQTALSNIANTLRAQAQQIPPQRKAGTLRGRRDVRNTIFIPSSQGPVDSGLLDGPAPPASPLNSPRAANLTSEDPRGSDAQSVRSAHSLTSLSKTAVRHPELSSPGLNASIIETVSTWFAHGQVTKAVVVGELALAHNATSSSSRAGTAAIRLENFPVLEKVAPNPSFIHQMTYRSGEYHVNLAQIPRTSVAFKYQVHLEESNLAAHAPVVLIPTWKIEPTQASVIISYTFNPAFASAAKRSVSLANVVVVVGIEGTKAVSCQSRPVGNFSKDKSLIYWRLGDITLDAYAEAPQKLLARFVTEAEAKPGNVEVRWEINGEHAAGLGSGLSLSLSQASSGKEEGTDPFADESAAVSANGVYKEVPMSRKILSGKYVAK